MKSATSLTPPGTGLSGNEFSNTILNVLESMTPKDQKNEKKPTEMKSGHRTANDTCCCDYKKSGKGRSIESNQTKIQK